MDARISEANKGASGGLRKIGGGLHWREDRAGIGDDAHGTIQALFNNDCL
jgi:hypothetical protein